MTAPDHRRIRSNDLLHRRGHPHMTRWSELGAAGYVGSGTCSKNPLLCPGIDLRAYPGQPSVGWSLGPCQGSPSAVRGIRTGSHGSVREKYLERCLLKPQVYFARLQIGIASRNAQNERHPSVYAHVVKKRSRGTSRGRSGPSARSSTVAYSSAAGSAPP
jgi:hypothetical protein